MLRINNLMVKYGDKTALNGISLSINKGEIVGYVGANGSGKTSTIKSIMNLIEYQGTIEIDGQSIKDNYIYKNKIGFIPENFAVFEGFSGDEYLKYVGGLQGISPSDCISRSQVLIKHFELNPVINQKIATYSKGTKQKLAIIASLIHRPPILLYDEPMDGLDPHAIELFKIIMRIHADNGGSVLFSSHILEVVADLSNRLIMISDGVIVSDSTIEEFSVIKESKMAISKLLNQLTLNIDYQAIRKSLENGYSSNE